MARESPSHATATWCVGIISKGNPVLASQIRTVRSVLVLASNCFPATLTGKRQ